MTRQQVITYCIMISIDKAWSQFQDDAGVDPAKRLNNYDHAQIEKDLTPAWQVKHV